ncbi:MAG: hypothetical protein K8T90_04850 [Planctomycetes bacterium]|nr:hypothetical protein [Planctomycetota bacterium]
MIRGTTRGGRALAAWLTVSAVGAALCVVAIVAAQATFAGPYGDGPYSFPHQPHLSPATISAGLAEAAALDRSGKRPGGGGVADKECRVCHNFAVSDDAHLDGCMTCHVAAKNLDAQFARAAPVGARFPHKEHLKDTSVTCFSCHRVEKEMGWVEFSLPEGGLGAAGTGGRPGGKHGDFTCTDCHRAHEPKGGLVKKDDVTGDGKPCETCHTGVTSILPQRFRSAANRGNDRSFLHGDHGAADGDCAKCHAAVKTSRTIWDYDPVAGTAQACESCHMDAEKKPLVGVASPGRTTRLPFVVFSKFPHEKHLAAPENKIETSGKVTDGCRTCHYPERDAAATKLFPARKASDEPVGRGALVDYDACVACHASWSAPGHGVGAWACFKCHSGAADAEGKLPVAKAKVARETISGGVKFANHDHPGVTRNGGTLADATDAGATSKDGKKLECRDCHIGDPSALTSALNGRAFKHGPHLPSAPSNTDCLACHTSSGTASWSADLQRFDPHFEAPVTRSDAGGSAKGCLVCHVGATREQLGLASVEKTVPEFDHKSHVVGAKWKGGLGVPCTGCHVEGGEIGYVTPADVADCTRCHAHDEKDAEKFARTGKKTSTPADAKNCKECHEEIRDALSPTKIAPRTHLSLLPGKQFHDKGGDCASCHAREGRTYVYAERVTKAKAATSIHEDADYAGQWFNNPAIEKPGVDPQGRTCDTCHRFKPRGFLRALGAR